MNEKDIKLQENVINGEDSEDEDKNIISNKCEVTQESCIDNKREVTQEELDSIKVELDEMNDRYKRLYAEYENYRKRNAKERLDLIETASKGLLREIIPISDDFDRALLSFKQNSDVITMHDGVKLINDKFKRVLNHIGVEPMHIESGTVFNAEMHEAVTKIPVEDEKLKGKIVDVLEKGYTLKDKVIKFAKVIIGS